jgi:hypothetical protein
MKLTGSMNRLLFQLERLGWPGALGVLLLLAALLADPLLLQPQEEQVANARADAARRALLPARDERRRTVRAIPRERVESALPRLFAAAANHTLDLHQARYTETGQGEGLRIDLPVMGTYPDLRAFLAELLDDNPALRLESLELSRDRIEDTHLEARLRLQLNQERTP